MKRKSRGPLVVGTIPDGLRDPTGGMFSTEMQYAGAPGTKIPAEYARAFKQAIKAMVLSALFAQAKRSGVKRIDSDRAQKLTLPFDRELVLTGAFWSDTPVMFRHGPTRPEHQWFVTFKSTKLMNALRSLVGDMYGLMTGAADAKQSRRRTVESVTHGSILDRLHRLVENIVCQSQRKRTIRRLHVL